MRYSDAGAPFEFIFLVGLYDYFWLFIQRGCAGLEFMHRVSGMPKDFADSINVVPELTRLVILIF